MPDELASVVEDEAFFLITLFTVCTQHGPVSTHYHFVSITDESQPVSCSNLIIRGDVSNMFYFFVKNRLVEVLITSGSTFFSAGSNCLRRLTDVLAL